MAMIFIIILIICLHGNVLIFQGETKCWSRSLSIDLEMIVMSKGTLLSEIRAITRRQAAAVTSMCTDPDCNFVISGDASKTL